MNEIIPSTETYQPPLHDAGGSDLTPHEQEIAMRLWRFFSQGPLKEVIQGILQQVQQPQAAAEMPMNPNQELDLGQSQEENPLQNTTQEIMPPEGQNQTDSQSIGSLSQQEPSLGADTTMPDTKTAKYQADEEIAQLKEKIRKLEAEKVVQETLLHLSSVTTYALPKEHASKVAVLATKLNETDRKSLFDVLAHVQPATANAVTKPQDVQQVAVYQGDATVAPKRQVSESLAYKAMMLVNQGKFETYQQALKHLGGDE